MVEKKYTQTEIFDIPWLMDFYSQWGFSLPRVGVEYKVKMVRKRFHVWIRCQKNAPYKLGVYFSLAEAQFRVYDHILYFSIYLDGSWTPQSRRVKI